MSDKNSEKEGCTQHKKKPSLQKAASHVITKSEFYRFLARACQPIKGRKSGPEKS